MIANNPITTKPDRTDRTTIYQVEGTQIFSRDLEKVVAAVAEFDRFTVIELDCRLDPIAELILDEFQAHLEGDIENIRLEHHTFNYEWLDSTEEFAFREEMQAVINKYFKATVLRDDRVVQYHEFKKGERV